MDVDVNEIGLEELPGRLPPELTDLLNRPGDGPALLVSELPSVYSPEYVSPKSGDAKTEEQRLWQLVGIAILKTRGPHEAIPIFQALYRQMLTGQSQFDYRVHKGMPLVHISDCYRLMGFATLAKRFAMLTLVEDTLLYEGDLDLNRSGATRLTSIFGMASGDFHQYVGSIHTVSENDTIESRFPEWVLQEIDQEWKVEIPALQEASTYVANATYLSHLHSKLGEKTGKALERMADYLVSSIPGCRTTSRKRSASTEYDIVCSIEGARPDFLSEVGRYFVCECKDTAKPASYSTIAKFTRVLDSTKSRLGLIFSPKGISGRSSMRYAERERIKVYQDRGIAILVLDSSDFQYFADGGNFVARIRARYEALRLDLLENM